MYSRLCQQLFRNNLAGPVGIEPTPLVSKTRMISISPKPDIEWSGVEESNLYNDFRRIMSYPLNERQLYVLYFVLCVYVNGALT